MRGSKGSGPVPERAVRGDEQGTLDPQIDHPRLGDLEHELATLGQGASFDLLSDDVPRRAQRRVEKEEEGRSSREEGFGIDGVPCGERAATAAVQAFFRKLERQRDAAPRQEVGGVAAQVEEGALGRLRRGPPWLSGALGR